MAGNVYGRPGLEGAIACESKIGYVNGAKGWLIYRGYDIFDLCAHGTFEEVSYLLMHGTLPTVKQLKTFKNKLVRYRSLNATLRLLMGFEVEKMNAMAALRLGTNLMRQEFTFVDPEEEEPTTADAIGADEDSIPMETLSGDVFADACRDIVEGMNTRSSILENNRIFRPRAMYTGEFNIIRAPR